MTNPVYYRIIDRKTERTLCIVGPFESGSKFVSEQLTAVVGGLTCACDADDYFFCNSKYRYEVTI